MLDTLTFEWRLFLDRFGWDSVVPDDPRLFASRGQAWSMPAAGGFELFHLALSAQTVVTSDRLRANGYWLLLVLDGGAIVRDGDRCIEVRRGDLCFGPIGHRITINVATTMDLQLVHFAHSGRVPKVFASTPLRGIDRLAASSVWAAQLAALLRSVSACTPLQAMSVDQIQPLELAISAFFIACATNSANLAPMHRSSTARKALLLRAYQRSNGDSRTTE